MSKKRRSKGDEPMFIVGKKMPWSQAAVQRALEGASDGLEDSVADPKERWERRIRDVEKDLTRKRAADCDAAAALGRKLLLMRNDKTCWDATLRRLHMSRRTAYHKMSLAIFESEYPELYQRFRTLGPTKLYRMASNPQKVKDLSLSDPVTLERGTVELGRLSDRELQAFLRKLCPVLQPSRTERAQRRMQAVKRMLRRMVGAADLTAAEFRSLRQAEDRFHAECRELFEGKRMA